MLIMMGTLMFLLSDFSCWILFLSMFMYLFMMRGANFSYLLSMDWMSLVMVGVVLWIMLGMLISTSLFTFNLSLWVFFKVFLLLLLNLLLCFSLDNIVLFYMMFEVSVVFIFFVIQYWGGSMEKVSAGWYILMYTITFSLPFILMSVLLYKSMNTNSMFMFMLSNNYISFFMQLMVLLVFMVKLPSYLFHLWLPKAHVEAPVFGSMLLAGVLLKLGGYGIMRIGMFIDWVVVKYLVMSVSIWGALYSGLLSFKQIDLKCMIAFMSISHMNLMLASFMLMKLISLYGMMMMMVSHGVSSSGMFCCFNRTYESSNTRSVLGNSGVLKLSPLWCMWMFLLVCMNMGVPPSFNFLSELVLMFSIGCGMLWGFILFCVVLLISCFYSVYFYTSITHGSSGGKGFDLECSFHLVMLYHVCPLLFLFLMS